MFRVRTCQLQARRCTSPEDPLGGQQGEGVLQIEAQAAAELGQGPCACAIASQRSFGDDVSDQAQVLHGPVTATSHSRQLVTLVRHADKLTTDREALQECESVMGCDAMAVCCSRVAV